MGEHNHFGHVLPGDRPAAPAGDHTNKVGEHIYYARHR